MPPLPISQQPDWNNNIYVLATTRILVMVGAAYLVKSLYTLIRLTWGTRSNFLAAVVTDGIDLGAIVTDALVTMPEAADDGTDLEANTTLEIHPPQPIYDPQNHTERPCANARAQYQSTEVSGQSVGDQSMPEHEVGLHNTDNHVEENMDIAVGVARREIAVESAADEKFAETATQPPGHTIRSSLNA